MAEPKAHAQGPATPDTSNPGGDDPSMEDILASIRRILGEGEAAAATAPEPLPPPAPKTRQPEPVASGEPEVFALDQSMLVEEAPVPAESAPPPEVVSPEPVASPPPVPQTSADMPPVPDHQESAPHAGPLVMPETAAAAASSVGSLLRTLTAQRHPVAVSRGGPTLEDMVREEMRPALKAWLDAHLPEMVERLVRAEIERVVSRATEL